MYVDIVPNRNSPPAILVRESRREGKVTKKRAIMNISDWPMDKVLALKLLLQGEKLIPAKDAFIIERSIPRGHAAAILGVVKKLGLDEIISPKPCPERDLALAMIVQRLVEPCSKLAATRLHGARQPRALRPRTRHSGRRPRHAHSDENRTSQEVSRPRLDQRAQEPGHKRPY